MANLTTASTFTPTVQGNRRVVFVEVGSTSGSTSDTVNIPYLSAITMLGDVRFTSATAYDTTQAQNRPQLFLGTSANDVQVLRSSLTTADAFDFFVEGR